MNTSDRIAASSLAEMLRRHDFAGGRGAAGAAADDDLRIEVILRAIRVAGADRETSISAGHRALVRSVVAR